MSRKEMTEEQWNKSEKRRNFLTKALSTVTILSVLILIYGILQRVEAEKQKEFAQMERDRSVALLNEAQKMQQEAERHRMEAENALEQCRKNNSN